MHNLLRVPPQDNPTVPALSPQLANHLQIAPLLALGTLDTEGRPWTTLLGGSPGLAGALGNGVVGIRVPVPVSHDPVVEALVGREAGGEVVRAEGKGRMVSGLTIDLAARKRVKLYGRMIAGALTAREDEVTDAEEKVAEVEVQLVLKIEQSLGNCPKYLNAKTITESPSKSELLSSSAQLVPRAVELLAKADLFFISSLSDDATGDMDTNHRGGPPGFLRLLSNGPEGAVLVYPEYSGNRLYQTLGNLLETPKAGVCVPDFETGDMLYLTCATRILVGKEAQEVLPRSDLAVVLEVTGARFVGSTLTFRGSEGQRSPYNPPVRFTASERKRLGSSQELAVSQQAMLMSQTKLTPNISRFRFRLEGGEKAVYKPGQWVTLDFSSHLNIGYSHMRDDDPTSLNDDFIRTFTVSSAPAALPSGEFQITIRKVGAVTGFLFRQQGSRSGDIEVGVKGFGGEFEVRQEDAEEEVAFIAAGVGITPLLPSLDTLELKRLVVLWSVRAEDLAIVKEVARLHPRFATSARVFVTGDVRTKEAEIAELKAMGCQIQASRMAEADVDVQWVKRFYVCAGVPMRRQLEGWLSGKELIYEDFNY